MLIARPRTLASLRLSKAVTLASCATLCLFFAAGVASGATLNVVGGQLVGASGVNVDGQLYDVAFLDGTCIALFSGCDSVSDFTFQTEAAASLAAQALLDQVFVDGGSGNFDTDPELTAGCIDPNVCLAVTLHAVIDAFGGGVGAYNYAPGVDVDAIETGIGGDPNADLSTFDDVVYAVWSPVPEPSTALFFGAGLVALAGGRRRTLVR